MTIFRVRVTQVFRVEKWIVMEVEAATREEALEKFEEGESPCSSLPGWQASWDLQNEEVAEEQNT